MSVGRAKQITTDQRRAMVEFIKDHPGCNTGAFPGPHGEKLKISTWSELASILNSMPGPSKTWQLWQKSFQDWKSECKTKSRHNKKHSKTTGNQVALRPISDLEQLCINLFISPIATEGNGTVDPDRDDEVPQNPEIEIDPIVILDEGGGDNLDNVEIVGEDGCVIQAIQVVASSSTPRTSEAVTPSAGSAKRRKTDSELKKSLMKRMRKEAELDEDKFSEIQHLKEHLADSNRSADALTSIAASLAQIAATQEAILGEQRSQTIYLQNILEKM